LYRNASDGEPLLASATVSAFEARKSGGGRTVRAIEAYQRAIWWLVGIGIVVAGAMIAWLDITVDVTGAGALSQLIAAAFIAARIARRKATRPRVADTLGTLGLVWFAGLNCGLISLLALHVQMPLADSWLYAVDRAAGIDGLAIVAWFAHQPKWLLSAMGAAYSYTIPVLFVSMGGLSMIDDRVESWRAAFCFIGSLLTICFISVVTPAKGLGVWAPPELMTALPDGWACYFWPSFDEFYRSAHPVLRLDALSGVISFPSFHTVMGLITLAMWRKRPAMLALASAWFLPMLASTVPVGGHYVVDVLAGAAVWAIWFTLSRAIERAPPRQRAPS
jgi:membrane-associated phospholipid phosphatase